MWCLASRGLVRSPAGAKLSVSGSRRTRHRRWGIVGISVQQLKKHTYLGKLVPVVHFVFDAFVWCIAVPVASLLRYLPEPIDWPLVVGLIAIAIALQGGLGYAIGVYRRRWRVGGSEEVFHLAVLTILIGLVFSVLIRFPAFDTMRYSVPALAPVIAVSLMYVERRAVRRLAASVRQSSRTVPTVIVGAGDAAYGLLNLLQQDGRSIHRPVALLDDDPLKSQLRLFGVDVRGTIADLPRVVRITGAEAVILAIPSADSDLVRMVDTLAHEAGVPLLSLPPVSKLFSLVSLADIRPVTESDLLGRTTADIDTDAIAAYITGRRVLVTGAGGSIGSELCRQLVRFEPSSLIMLDRDESLLAETQMSIEGRALLDNPSLVLADIRDHKRMLDVFEQYRPEVVFHAAALKHLTLLEKNPHEAWKTNVLGTMNVLEASAASGVERFVNISTDKAAEPTSVLGCTKRITERLTSDMAQRTGRAFVSVRFGNVLGSRGSVLTIFRAQAELGGPLTVTDPAVTRYFMTIQEATRLTALAGAIGTGGEALVLDMGAPVRIADVARRFARQHEPELEIVYTGLRNGEKLHEVLLASDEEDRRPIHPQITHVAVPPITFENLVKKMSVKDDRIRQSMVTAATAS